LNIFENVYRPRPTPEMYLSDFYIPVNTPVGGGGAATQTFAPGGKYPRAARH